MHTPLTRSLITAMPLFTPTVVDIKSIGSLIDERCTPKGVGANFVKSCLILKPAITMFLGQKAQETSRVRSVLARRVRADTAFEGPPKQQVLRLPRRFTQSGPTIGKRLVLRRIAGLVLILGSTEENVFGKPLNPAYIAGELATVSIEGGMCPKLPLVLLSLVEALDRAGLSRIFPSKRFGD